MSALNWRQVNARFASGRVRELHTHARDRTQRSSYRVNRVQGPQAPQRGARERKISADYTGLPYALLDFDDASRKLAEERPNSRGRVDYN
jgi:hypothetical protein